MADNDVPIEAISVQNEPDIDFFRPEGPITYPGCQWMPDQIANFLLEQGPRFGDTKLMAPESFNFNRDWSDPLLNDPAVAAEFEIVGGHIYGNGLRDYPLARERGKEVWMTEHYTDSGSEPDRANLWPLAFDVATELHASMEANFNAYVWWVIRRQYGFVFDSGVATKRGYIMSQFARFVRPGFVRVAASTPAADGVVATAYKNGPGSVVVVVLNQG
jgi:O-glycosyl hydrolase